MHVVEKSSHVHDNASLSYFSMYNTEEIYFRIVVIQSLSTTWNPTEMAINLCTSYEINFAEQVGIYICFLASFVVHSFCECFNVAMCSPSPYHTYSKIILKKKMEAKQTETRHTALPCCETNESFEKT